MEIVATPIYTNQQGNIENITCKYEPRAEKQKRSTKFI